jgi:hypothetical protein
VTVTSIIDIEVRDEQILKFVELMKQQREMVKQLPSEWRAAGGAIADVTGEMDELVALYRERTELSKKNREEDRKEAAEKAEARETAAAKSKEERNLALEEREAERAPPPPPRVRSRLKRTRRRPTSHASAKGPRKTTRRRSRPFGKRSRNRRAPLPGILAWA